MSTRGGSRIVQDGLYLYVDPANHKSYEDGIINAIDNLGSSRNGGGFSGGFSTDNQGVWDFSAGDNILSLSPALTTPNLTYSIWFKPSASDTTFRNLGCTSNVSGVYTIEFSLFMHCGLGTINVATKAKDIGADRTYDTGPSFIGTGWHHATVTITPTTIQLYFNGEPVGAPYTRINTTDMVMSNLYLGRNMGYGFYTGQYGPIQLYDRELSDLEILQNYNALKTRFGL